MNGASVNMSTTMSLIFITIIFKKKNNKKKELNKKKGKTNCCFFSETKHSKEFLCCNIITNSHINSSVHNCTISFRIRFRGNRIAIFITTKFLKGNKFFSVHQFVPLFCGKRSEQRFNNVVSFEIFCNC